MSFQENLKKYRIKAGYYSAKDFAKDLGISYTTYMSYENKGSEAKQNILCKISKLLNVSTDILIDNTIPEEIIFFQENLKKYRIKAGYKQAKEFAKKLGIPYQRYMNYENKGSEPPYHLLCKICKLLNVSADIILNTGIENENIIGHLNSCKSINLKISLNKAEINIINNELYIKINKK